MANESVFSVGIPEPKHGSCQPGGDEPASWVGDRPNLYMGVSKNSGTPKSSILIGFSIINHPFWGTIIFGNTHMYNGYVI